MPRARTIAIHTACSAALSLCMATAAGAQVASVAEELRLNVHASGVLLGGASDRAVRPGLSASYGNSRYFAVFVTWDRAPFHDGEHPYRLQHFDTGVRVHLRDARSAVVPFGLIAYTWRSAQYGERFFMGDTLDVTVYGTGFTVGGGVLYYPRPRLAVEASAKRSGGPMDRVDASDIHFRDPESAIRRASVRLNVGLSWFPYVPRPR